MLWFVDTFTNKNTYLKKTENLLQHLVISQGFFAKFRFTVRGFSCFYCKKYVDNVVRY